jgi:hypothetical protein
MLCVPLTAVLCADALPYPRPPFGTENIPKLMADYRARRIEIGNCCGSPSPSSTRVPLTLNDPLWY